MSKNIVLAGAGALGKHVLDELLRDDDFNVTVLSRSSKPELEKKGAIVKVVDYDDLASLNAALSGADTLLSFIIDFKDPEAQARAHRNLLSAAASQHLRRFVPAEYANDLARFPAPPTIERDKLHFREHLRDVCRREGIEYTLVCNGILMDFFIPAGRKKYFPDAPEPPPLDGAGATALVPGSPLDKISFTLADDVARVVARLLRAPAGEWAHRGEFTYVSGDRATWEEAATALERALGGPVRRTRVPLAELSARVDRLKAEGAADDDMGLMWAELEEIFGNGSEVLPLNWSGCEGIAFTRLGEIFDKYYGCDGGSKA